MTSTVIEMMNSAKAQRKEGDRVVAARCARAGAPSERTKNKSADAL